MELVFGLLPLPVAVGVLVVVGAVGVGVKLFAKSKAVKDVTGAVVDSVLTKDRIDQTVEAVLARLKVDHQLADKIGDLIAEIVVNVVGTKRSLADKSTIIAEAVTASDRVVPAVAHELTKGPTPLDNVIRDCGDSAMQEPKNRQAVAAAVVRAYARQAVL